MKSNSEEWESGFILNPSKVYFVPEIIVDRFAPDKLPVFKEEPLEDTGYKVHFKEYPIFDKGHERSTY